MTYRVKNWSRFQHYRNRRPPWIKLHHTLLDDVDFIRLHVASRALAPLVWLLASESEDGSFGGDVAFRLRLPAKEVDEGLKGLIQAGYIECLQDASKTLAERKQPATPETETEGETETETEGELLLIAGANERCDGTGPKLSPAETIYNAYPRKVGKQNAIKAIQAVLKRQPFERILEATQAFAQAVAKWPAGDEQFVPYPATWFHAGRYEDDRKNWERVQVNGNGSRGGLSLGQQVRLLEDEAKALKTRIDSMPAGEERTAAIRELDGLRKRKAEIVAKGMQ